MPPATLMGTLRHPPLPSAMGMTKRFRPKPGEIESQITSLDGQRHYAFYLVYSGLYESLIQAFSDSAQDITNHLRVHRPLRDQTARVYELRDNGEVGYGLYPVSIEDFLSMHPVVLTDGKPI